jgi:hypothetical protein
MFSNWRWIYYISPKHQRNYTGIQGVTSQFSSACTLFGKTVHCVHSDIPLSEPIEGKESCDNFLLVSSVGPTCVSYQPSQKRVLKTYLLYFLTTCFDRRLLLSDENRLFLGLLHSIMFLQKQSVYVLAIISLCFHMMMYAVGRNIQWEEIISMFLLQACETVGVIPIYTP